jgi:hypothetical protein
MPIENFLSLPISGPEFKDSRLTRRIPSHKIGALVPSKERRHYDNHHRIPTFCFERASRR